MQPDSEFQRWQEEWQSQGTVPESLVRRVHRHTRVMWWGVASEIAVTLLIGGGSVAWAVASGRRDVAVLAGGVWILIVIAWTTSVLLRRGAWEPVEATTSAFIEVSILRCRRGRQAVVAQGVLYAIILAFDLAWIYREQAKYASEGVPSFLMSRGVGWIWFVTAALAVAAVRRRQRLTRELDMLTNLRNTAADTIGNTDVEGEMARWDSHLKTVKRSVKKRRRGGASAKN